MSLVIKKFAEGGSSDIRLYKRGNDNVDLNAFIRKAEGGFDNWLDKADIKPEYKKEVRTAYQDMINRINDDPESFVARLGGGFTNTAGITNKEKGFDSYGVAAGYLGKTLRGMQVYTKPEVKSNKTKYNRNSGFITPDMQRQVVGDNPDSFVMLDNDSYDENTGKRALIHRLAQTAIGLEALKDHLKDHKEFDSEEDYNHARARIDSAIQILKNNNPNDDWFALEQLGMTGLDKFFYTGETKRPTQQQSPSPTQQQSGNQGSGNQGSGAYPQHTGTLHADVPLSSPSDLPIANKALTIFKNKFNSLSNKDLKTWIQRYINNIDSYDINNNEDIRKIYGHYYTNFNTGQIISTILNKMKSIGMLKQFSANSPMYYIPGTRRNGTGYVWDTSTNTLHHMYISDIPYFANESSQNNSSTGMYRKGGVLIAQEGSKLWYENLSDFNPANYTSNYDTSKLIKGDIFKSNLNPWVSDKNGLGLGRYAPSEENTRKYARQVENLLYYQTFGKDIIGSDGKFTKVGEAWAKAVDSMLPKGSLASFYDNNGNLRTSWTSNTKDVYNRSANNFDNLSNYVNYVRNDNILGARHNVFRKTGNRYFYKDESGNRHWVDPSVISNYTVSTDPVSQDWNDDKTIYWKDYELTGLKSPTEVKKDPSQKYNIDEVSSKIKGNNPNLARSGFWGELGTDLLGASRLAGSILANNRIAKTVRNSLRPKLHDTYELYSPITGAFSEMQLRNRQGAKALSQSYKPFTSDASLASARMLEGQEQANNLQYQGFIADDKEIKRTQAEALQRQEDNIARRSALANENRDAILANNQAKAQLEASRIKQNWNSIDNYLKEVEGSTKQRLAENRDRRNEFLMQTGQFISQQERQARINDILQDFRNYQAKYGTTKTLSDFNNATRGEYEKAISAINADYKMSQLANYGRIFGYNFPLPKDYVPYDRNNYNLTIYKQGGTIKLNSSQLIDKIIRKNNEGNS